MSRDDEIARLRARIEELESIVENSPDIIARFDRELRHVYVNRAIVAASGMSADEFRGKTHEQLGMPDELVEPWRQVYRQVFETGVEGRKEFVFTGPDGARSYVSRVVPEFGPDGTVQTVLSVARDVTDWKNAEEHRLALERRLQEANKLESLGLLAGGIAHDFNNLLTGVLAGASLLAAHTPKPEVAREVAAQLEKSALRAAELCRQLLAYAGRAQVSERELDLGELCATTVELVNGAVPHSVRVVVVREDTEHFVLGDPVQLRQVVMNLVLNAIEAIGERSGEVRVHARSVPSVEIPSESKIVGPDDPEGPHVHLRVADDGRGMDASTIPRIFEPFFTTHFHGRGLGLSAVLGTVRANRGLLFVTSAEGRGTTFDLYFPARPRSEMSPVEVRRAPARSLEGTRLLIVDDERDVLDSASLLARSAGIDPAVASSGDAALDWLRGASDVDVVLLDLTMPGVDGITTLSRIRDTHPELPVVLMSGFAEAEALAAAGRWKVASFLQKPFGLHQLVEALSGAVAAGR